MTASLPFDIKLPTPQSARPSILTYLKPIERLLRGLLYLAPLAADSDNEVIVQGLQSVSDLLDLLKAQKLDDVVNPGIYHLQVLRKVVEVFQLFAEMRAKQSENKFPGVVVKIEFIKVVLTLLSWKRGQRLIPDNENSDIGLPDIAPRKYKELPKRLLISDALRLTAPLMFVLMRKRGDSRGALVVYATMQILSIALLEEDHEIKNRLRTLPLDILLRKPLYDVTLRPPLIGLNSLWNKIPFINSINFLQYYLNLNDKYYYYLEGAKSL